VALLGDGALFLPILVARAMQTLEQVVQ
jgi:hypothetical protein